MTSGVAGRNLVIEYRDAEGKLERLPALAAQLVALPVDVIVTGGGTPAALAAKRATSTVPIVFPAAADPVTDGLVTSLARPERNVTGLSLLAPDLVGKRLEQFKQAVPGPITWPFSFVEARGVADFERAFSDMARARVNALTVLPSPTFLYERRRLVDLAARSRLPTVFAFREYVDVGGLMSYGPDIANMYRRAATYVDKILRGAHAGDLPIEQPTKFELVINLKTARALGLTMQPSVLQRADEVIE